MIFDKKTGIQTNNAKGDRWANKIYPADELEQHLTGKQAPAAKSKTAKKDEKKPAAKTKKPAKILAAAPVEDAAPAPARSGRKAQAAEEAAPALSREQVIAVKKFDAAVAEFKAAFGIG
jgi:hypothetical protein